MPGCPQRYVGELWELTQYADLFYKGLAPESGGVLDQTKWFTESARFYKSEQARVKMDELEKVK